MGCYVCETFKQMKVMEKRTPVLRKDLVVGQWYADIEGIGMLKPEFLQYKGSDEHGAYFKPLSVNTGYQVGTEGLVGFSGESSFYLPTEEEFTTRIK